MEFLALLFLVLSGLIVVLPGSLYKEKPVINFESPFLYMNIMCFFISIAMAIYILF